MDDRLTQARKLAQRISRLGARDPNLEGLLEDYARVVDELVASPVLAEVSKTDLEELNSLHAGVVQAVQNLKDQTKGEIRASHQKGKAIMTYADRLPKTISSRRRRA